MTTEPSSYDHYKAFPFASLGERSTAENALKIQKDRLKESLKVRGARASAEDLLNPAAKYHRQKRDYRARGAPFNMEKVNLDWDNMVSRMGRSEYAHPSIGPMHDMATSLKSGFDKTKFRVVYNAINEYGLPDPMAMFRVGGELDIGLYKWFLLDTYRAFRIALQLANVLDRKLLEKVFRNGFSPEDVAELEEASGLVKLAALEPVTGASLQTMLNTAEHLARSLRAVVEVYEMIDMGRNVDTKDILKVQHKRALRRRRVAKQLEDLKAGVKPKFARRAVAFPELKQDRDREFDTYTWTASPMVRRHEFEDRVREGVARAELVLRPRAEEYAKLVSQAHDSLPTSGSMLAADKMDQKMFLAKAIASARKDAKKHARRLATFNDDRAASRRAGAGAGSGSSREDLLDGSDLGGRHRHQSALWYLFH